MPIMNIIGTIAPIITGFLTANAAKSSGNVQADAANLATANTRGMYEEGRMDLSPYNQVGKGAMYSLADLYGLPTPGHPQGGQPFGGTAMAAFNKSPDYAYAKREGIKDLDASASSRGGLLSGNQFKAIQSYGSNLASQNFNNYAGRLMSLAGLGENAAAQTAASGNNAAGNMANSIMAAGQGNAAGIIGANNAVMNGFNQGFNNFSQGYGFLGQNSSFNGGH